MVTTLKNFLKLGFWSNRIVLTRLVIGWLGNNNFWLSARWDQTNHSITVHSSVFLFVIWIKVCLVPPYTSIYHHSVNLMVRWLSEIDSKKVRKNRIYRLDTPFTIGVSLFADSKLTLYDLGGHCGLIEIFGYCTTSKQWQKTLCDLRLWVWSYRQSFCTRDSITRDPGVIYVKKGYIYAYTYP